MLSNIGRILAWVFFRAPLLWIALLGMAVTIPSLSVKLAADDYKFRDYFLSAKKENIPWYRKDNPHWYYTGIMVDGNPETTSALRCHSILPWWTSPKMRVAFFRAMPLFTWALDYTLWPDTVWLMHLHNLIWYGLVCFLAGVVFRRFCADRYAVILMAVLYAIDDTHALPVGWISNRGGLIAACFAFISIIAHDRWRRDGSKIDAWIAPISMMITLLSSELGVCVLAYFIAYAFSFDRGKLTSRIAAILPSLLAVVVWRIGYTVYGFGAVNSGFYIDPGRQPIAFLSEWPLRHAFYYTFQFGFTGLLLYYLADIVGTRLLYIVPLIIGGGVLYLVVRRASRDPEIRFWAISLLLAPVPLSSALPTEQLLVIAGLAGSALVAHLILSIIRTWPTISLSRRAIAGTVLALAIFINIILSPIALAYGSSIVGRTYLYLGFLPAAVMGHDESYPNHDLVVVNSPDAVHAIMIQHERGVWNLPLFKHVWILGSGNEDVRVKRVDDHTLELTTEGGYLADPLAAHFRGPGDPFKSGEEIKLMGITVTVVEITKDGRPLYVHFRFDTPLDDPRLHYIVWDGRDYGLFPLPRAGQTVLLPKGRLHP
jgi:hypothetical protein